MTTMQRDPIGEHPLYYRQTGINLTPARDIRDLVGSHDSLDEDAMAAFLFHQYTPGRDTVYMPIKKVRPGWMIDTGSSEPLRQHWSLTDHVLDGYSDHHWAFRVRDLVTNVVKRMVGDAEEVAVFLSGGLDSSIIAALVVDAMQGRGRVHSFSIGFPTFSEQSHAQVVATRLGTVHHEILVTPEMALECIPDLMKHASEPIGDAATVCNYILAREMKKFGLDLAFSGDGGDEVFAGYPWHWLATALKIPFNLPRLVKALGRGILDMVPNHDDLHSRLAEYHARAGVFVQPVWWHTQAFMQKALTVPEIKRLTNLPTDDINVGLRVPQGFSNRLNEVQAFDIMNILPTKFCMKAHWAVTLAGVTELAPFLDPEVVRTAFLMPPEMKLRGRVGKWILRRAFQDLVPPHILDRPKQGFGVPIAEWLKDDNFKRSVAVALTMSEFAQRYYKRDKMANLLTKIATNGCRSYREANSIWTLYALAGWHEACVA